MIEDLPDVPPALSLILREMRAASSWDEMRRRVKVILPDLRNQSEVYATADIDRKSDTGRSVHFDVHLDGAMDLLLGKGCAAPQCRFATADRIARSVCLIADHVWVTDLLSERFIDFGRATNEKLDQVISDVAVLSRLLPLIEAGILKFRSPWISACQSCLSSFEKSVNATAAELEEVFSGEFRFEKRVDGIYFHTGKCIEPPLLFSPRLRERQRIPNQRRVIKEWVTDEVRSTLWKAREASLTGGAVFSNSRIGLAGLLKQEGRLVDLRTLLLIDNEREFSVPWVSELNAAQVVQLREEASSALPLFREKMAKAMSVSTAEKLSSSASSTVVADLREQAAEVRAELESKQANSARYWKVTYGLLGLGLSAYGVGTDQVLAGVGGLLPIIHLLIDHKTGQEAEVAKLTTKPGFVLVKAQDILSHAH